MSHYNPYPAYRDSGVEWIGLIPTHWSVLSIKTISDIANGATPESGNSAYWDGGIAWFTPADIDNEIVKFLAEPLRRITDAGLASCAAKLTPAGSVVLSTRAPIGSIGITAIPSATNQGCRSLIPMPGLPPLLLASVLLAARKDLALRSNGTTFQELSSESLRSTRIPLPPVAERARITDWIQSETARIDALIEKKTLFIDLLKLKRQSLITNAVIKGIDSLVELRDSGVEWIGAIPCHWSVMRMGNIYREANRPGDPTLPVLSISIHDGISDDELAQEDRDRRVSHIEDREKYKRVVPGDLAYNMMRAWQGGFGAVMVDGLVSPAYVVAEPTREIRSDFIELLLRTAMAIEEMRRFSRGIADFRMRLYWDDFKNIRVCLPPIAEQSRILEFIAKASSRIDLLAEKTQESITLLKERRTALITAAVTGQIDLREDIA